MAPRPATSQGKGRGGGDGGGDGSATRNGESKVSEKELAMATTDRIEVMRASECRRACVLAPCDDARSRFLPPFALSPLPPTLVQVCRGTGVPTAVGANQRVPVPTLSEERMEYIRERASVEPAALLAAEEVSQ